MDNTSIPFTLAHIDHVAIIAEDMERSQNWYNKVLGLKALKLEKWGDFPVFMVSGNFGVAIFPNRSEVVSGKSRAQSLIIDHFAFRVSNEDFNKAKTHFNEHKIEFEFQDHHYFHSVYLEDPDGHTVELTTLISESNPLE